MNKHVFKLLIILNSCVLLNIVKTANVTCSWIFYQSEVEENLKKFRKF